MNMGDLEKLQTWLWNEVKARDLTLAEASRRAGLNQGAISAIMNGTIPGLRQCKALARYFGIPLETVLEMAGHEHKPGSADDPLLERIIGVYADLDERRREELLVIAEAFQRVQRLEAKRAKE